MTEQNAMIDLRDSTPQDLLVVSQTLLQISKLLKQQGLRLQVRKIVRGDTHTCCRLTPCSCCS